ILFTTSLHGQSPVFQAENFYQEIPFKWLKGKVLIPVQIGEDTYDFVLDSGGLFMISEKVQSKYRFDTTRTVQVGGINNFSEDLAKVRVPQVQIGELVYTDYQAIIGPFFSQEPTTCLQSDGIIGRDFLEKMAVQYDLAQGKIVLTDNPEKLNLSAAQYIRMDIRGDGIPRLKLKTSLGKLKRVAFDSGANDLLSLKRSEAQKWIEQGKIPSGDVMELFGIFSMGVSGKIPAPAVNHRIKVRELQLGSYRLNDFYTDTGKPSGARIGTGLFPYGTVTTDYTNKRFYFLPYPKALDVAESPNFGFKVYVRNGKMLVTNITVGSPADQKGMKPGAEILALNGQPAETYLQHICQSYLEGFEWEKLDEVEVEFQVEGERPQKIILYPY
ncbi:MAG: aspartyl protease family protein, partial [Bacteroidota bacterium]